MTSYIDHLETTFLSISKTMGDMFWHMYEPSRVVKRWKGRTFVVRKFSCHRDECGICGKKALTGSFRSKTMVL